MSDLYKPPSARVPAAWLEEESPRASGWRKALMIFGGICAALVLLIVVVFGTLAYMGRGLDDGSKRYAEEATRQIVGQWDAQQLLNRGSAEFMSFVKPGDLDKMFVMFRKLGKLQQADAAQGQANIAMTTAKGKVVTAQYRIHARFENGPAEILITLIQHQEQWQIYGFRVNSEVFVKP